MNDRIFLLDTCFLDKSLQGYPLAAICEMTADLGVGAIMPILGVHPDAEIARAPRAAGIDLAAVYCNTSLTDGPEALRRNLDPVPHGVDLELALMQPGDDRDPLAAACAVLDTALAHAEERDCRVVLYPHISYYTDRVEVCCELCRRYDHPRLRTAFCGFHWYAVDGTDPAPRIAEAAPYLASINLSGSRRRPGPNGGCTIEPLDQGEVDNALLLALCEQQGFTGRVGIQGYGICGDPLAHLPRSVAYLRAALERVQAHPQWYRHATGDQAPSPSNWSKNST